MVYHENILCVALQPLMDNGIANPGLWKKWVRNGAEQVQKGGNGRIALLKLSTIPEKYQEAIKSVFGSPDQHAKAKPFKDKVVADEKAVTYFTNYLLADGRHLEEKYIKEYCINANVLNAVLKVFNDQQQSRKALGGNMRNFWQNASEAVNGIRGEVLHTLPTSKERLFKTAKAYQADGYYSLISKKFGNDNTLKVNDDLERLILSIYTMPNKPFGADVHTDYMRFLSGKIQLVDTRTGELFEPNQFKNKKGEYITISQSTVWNVLNKPHNRALVDSKRNGSFQFNAMHRPYHHRLAPEFSFSKISLDDRDLPRLSDEKARVKAYYAYDVASGCVIGKAYSRSKDEELFIECLRDMFRLIEKHDYGMPLEVEVENHLVNKFFDDLGMMFPFIRICNPGNSQEKRAEHFNNAKKYGVEKKQQIGIGRWWAKSEARRVDQAKVNDEFVQKVFTFDSLVADDLAAIKTYNNSLHPKQKKYPGKTRWQVLVENMNPNTAKISKPVVYKAIGEVTNTSIVRNQGCHVRGEKYIIPNQGVMERLQPNDYNVQAYYLPDNDGLISEVFLYQNNQFVCKADKVARYQESKAEQVAGRDDVAYTNQAKFVSSFDTKIKEGKETLSKIQIIDAAKLEESINVEPVIVKTASFEEDSIEDLLSNYNPQDYLDQANENL